MTSRIRASGEGSIFPYRNGYAAYVWVTKTNGQRQRKYFYGKTREQVHSKWLTLQQRARQGPVATSVPALGSFLTYWLDEVVKPNLAPLTHATYETFVRPYITPGLGRTSSTKDRRRHSTTGRRCRLARGRMDPHHTLGHPHRTPQFQPRLGYPLP